MFSKYKIVRWNKNDWIRFTVGFVTGVLSTAATVVLIMFAKYGTDNIQKNDITDKDITSIGLSILIMIAIGFVAIFFSFISKIYFSKVSSAKIAEVRKSIFDKTQDLSISDFQGYNINSLMTRLTFDVFNYAMFYNWLMINVISSMIRWVIFSAIVLYINWFIFLMIFILNIFLILITFLISRRAHVFQEKSILNIDKANKIIDENITGIRIVKAFNLFERQIQRFVKINSKISDYSAKAEIRAFISVPFGIAFINSAAILVILFSTIVRWSGGSLGNQIDIGDIMVIFSYAYLILWSLYDLAFLYVYYARSLASRKRIYDIQMLSSQSINYEGSLFNYGQIEFKNVFFKYFKESNDYALRDISFKVPKNSSIGIIGETGAGKSTILNLVSGIWHATDGQILIDNQDIKTINTKSLLDNISFAFQDKRILFSGSIEDNIKFSNPNLTDEEMKDVLKISQLEEFIKTNKDGIKYELEEFGQNLSGGQKQRINVARAVAKRAKIYLFDDITSALDNITEQRLINQLKKSFSDATIIMCSQKISTIKHMDQIIVLDEGKISSIGTHQALLKKDSIYKKIYELQTQRKETYEK